MVSTFVGPQVMAQRDRALNRANAIRTARKQIKEKLARGELTLEELILDPPQECLTALIGDVLEWMPGIGRWRANKILSVRGGPPLPLARTVRLGELPRAARERIARQVHIYASRCW